MDWDDDIAAGAADECLRSAMDAVNYASSALAEAARRAKGVPELEQAGVVERIEGDAQARVNEAWAALKGAIELARNAMATKETSDGVD